jgi:hypothetical protein
MPTLDKKDGSAHIFFIEGLVEAERIKNGTRETQKINPDLEPHETFNPV